MPPLSRREKEKKQIRKSNALEWAKKLPQGGESTSIKLPEGYESFKIEAPEKGTKVYKVDFMPYVVGKGNPNADEGMEHFERTFDLHWLPKGNKKVPVVCRQSFGKRCAVCNKLEREGGIMDPELVKSMRNKTRQIWLVNDKPSDPKNRLKIFEAGVFNRGMGFGEQMAAALNSVEDYQNFTDLENGYTLQLTVAKQTMGGGQKYNAVTRIDFVPRKYSYPESVRDDAPCLDEMLIDPGYDEVVSLLESGSSEEEEEREERPSRNGRSQVSKDEDEEEPENEKEEEEEEEEERPTRKTTAKGGKKEKTAKECGIVVGDVVVYDNMECDVIKVSPDGTSLTLKDDDGEKYMGVAPEDVEKVRTKEDEEEEEDEAPPQDEPAKKKTQKPAPKRGRDEEEDEDDEDSDDDDDEEEEEMPRRGRR